MRPHSALLVASADEVERVADHVTMIDHGPDRAERPAGCHQGIGIRSSLEAFIAHVGSARCGRRGVDRAVARSRHRREFRAGHRWGLIALAGICGLGDDQAADPRVGLTFNMAVMSGLRSS